MLKSPVPVFHPERKIHSGDITKGTQFVSPTGSPSNREYTLWLFKVAMEHKQCLVGKSSQII